MLCVICQGILLNVEGGYSKQFDEQPVPVLPSSCDVFGGYTILFVRKKDKNEVELGLRR